MASTGPSYSRSELLWIINSGCSRYITFYKEAFTKYLLLSVPIKVNTANRAYILAIAEGTILLSIAIGDTIRTIALTRVLHVPKLIGSLLSIIQL
jgi:hypothetical protein